MNKNEAFSRVIIDAMLATQGWNTTDPNAGRFEVVMPDGTRADYVLRDRHDRSLAVIEAKRYAVNSADAAGQARGYARLMSVPLSSLPAIRRYCQGPSRVRRPAGASFFLKGEPVSLSAIGLLFYCWRARRSKLDLLPGLQWGSGSKG